MDNVLLGDSIPASGVGSGPFDLIFIIFLVRLRLGLDRFGCDQNTCTDWATSFNVDVELTKLPTEGSLKFI